MFMKEKKYEREKCSQNSTRPLFLQTYDRRNFLLEQARFSWNNWRQIGERVWWMSRTLTVIASDSSRRDSRIFVLLNRHSPPTRRREKVELLRSDPPLRKHAVPNSSAWHPLRNLH